MDPLSITASIITLLGTGGIIAKGFRKVRGLKNAPSILLQLNNEVSELTLLVQAVEEVYRWHRTAWASSTQEAVLCGALERARHVVLDLEKLVENALTRRASWISSFDKIKEMKTTVRATRDELITVWAALSNRRVGTTRLHFPH